MDYADAVNVILRHGVGRDDVSPDEAVARDGFVGSLRPFSGLNEKNFLDVINAVVALRPHIRDQRRVERTVVVAIWDITVTARAWSLDPGGMLQRNKLITPADTARLLRWVRCIEEAALLLFSGGDPTTVLEEYRASPG